MAHRKIDWSARGWARVFLVTVGGALGCVAVALTVDSFSFMNLPAAERVRPILINILLPIALAMPLLFFFMSKLRELAIAHHKLQIVASTDSLTAVLNRGAFTMLVDAYLGRVEEQETAYKGALLVIDADHFKAINDRYGHDRGDDALKIIARAIESTLRGADIVGRIGGEEFGVFLPGSTPQQAQGVAERIRKAIADAEFTPDGSRAELSVSVGGVSFNHNVPFTELYRLADQRLYQAKQAGRNRVALMTMAEAA
jgi:diguanylate cyclase (GGDEF)-like protein